MTSVAVDVLGGDDAPGAVLDGAALALGADPGLRLLLVGPPEAAEPLAAHPRVHVVPASGRIGMGDDPVRAVRATRDATVRVAMRLVRDGDAQAAVSAGPTGATMAAALFTIGLVPGMTRPPLAVTVPALRGPVVLLDAGANVDSGADLLVQFALAGAALAEVRHGVEHPRVGLLSIGSEPGKGDALRKEAFGLLADSPLRFVGNVEPDAVTSGDVADVVVTDGFAGNVLLKSLEAMHGFARRVVAHVPVAADALAATSPERGAGVLLGVDGVVVVGHGASGPAAVASCIAAAAAAARGDLPTRVAAALAGLVRRRRELAGLS